MNPNEIYRKAIQRTFADLYSVSPETVEVVWVNDGESITVQCAGRTFTHQTNSESNEFISDDEDPVTIPLADSERREIQYAAGIG